VFSDQVFSPVPVIFLIKEGHQVGTLLWLLNDFAISVYWQL